MKRIRLPQGISDGSPEGPLDSTSGCAFAVGFLQGFEAGAAGLKEPDLEEIERRYVEAQHDLVFTIKEDLDLS